MPTTAQFNCTDSPPRSPDTAVCDLSKEHLDTFIGSLDTMKTTSRNRRAANSAKSRNHYRATIRQFLQWAVRKDYLPRRIA